MNKQPTLEQDRKKRRSRRKLHDLAPKKDLKGGKLGQISGVSERIIWNPNVPSGISQTRFFTDQVRLDKIWQWWIGRSVGRCWINAASSHA
jgi:hypothetical protein